jgi:predicted AlkP superfamily phosphohydrolase/phosphomutase
VEPSGYPKVRDELAAVLLELRLPDTGERVIDKVLRREEIYHGELLTRAADLLAIPFNGFDLKADVKKDSLTEKTAVAGMHTYDDATLFIRGQSAIRPDVEIVDLLPTICVLMDVPIPDDVDGQVAI